MPDPGNQTPSTATSAASGVTVTAATVTATATASTKGTELTAEEADSQLNSLTVKPDMTLGNGGSNFHSWNKMLLSQARVKRCLMAFYKDYPDSAVDAAATQLLMSSISPSFQRSVSSPPTAHRGYKHIKEKYSGGKNQEANHTWQQELREGIRPKKLLDEYILRCEGLHSCLTGNGVAMMEYQAYKEMIEGLPEEFEPVRYTLMGNLANWEWDQVLPTIKAIAYMIGYSDKSRSEEAAANLALNRGPGHGPGPAAPGNRPGAGQQQRPRSPAKERKPPFCKCCRQTGHLQRDSPKTKEEEAIKARVEHVAARIDHLELQLGEALPPMANAARGHSSSRSGRSSASTRDPDGDWTGLIHLGENFHAVSPPFTPDQSPPPTWHGFWTVALPSTL
jgi:hypothetical protein